MQHQSYTSATPPASQLNLFSAWLVHLYTAAGVIAAFFGVLAVLDGRYRDAFLLMLFATVVDATDGILARWARVKVVLPGLDGAKLDDIVDYLTYVFLPVMLLHQSGALPETWGEAVAAVVLVSSLLGFASSDAKTDDHFFTGFPSYWNIVALYLHIADFGAAVNAAILLTLSALVFWRVRYIYPTRTPVLRGVTISLGAIWAVLVLLMILALPAVRPMLVIASSVFPAYYLVLSAAVNMRLKRGTTAG